MSKKWWIVFILVGVILIVLLAVPYLVNVNSYRGVIENQISQSLNRSVKLNDLRLSIFPLAIESKDVHIGDDPAFRREDFVTIQSFRLHVAFWPLLQKQIHVTSLELVGPTVWLFQNARGIWNFSTLGQKSSSSIPVVEAGFAPSSPAGPDMGSLDISNLRIKNGRIIMLDQAKPKENESYDILDFQAQHISLQSPIPFSLKASGTEFKEPIEVDGEAGPLNASNLADSPAHGNLKADVFHFGKLKISNLQGQFKWNRQVLQLDPLEFDLYKGHQSGRATMDLSGARTGLEARGNLTKMDMNQFLSDFGSAKDQLYGTLSGQYDLKSSLGKNIDLLQALTGHGKLDLEKGKLPHINIGREISSIAKLAGLNIPENETVINKMTGDFDIANNWAKTNNLQISIPDIDLLCQGAFSFNQDLNFDVLATLTQNASQQVQSKTPVGGLLNVLMADKSKPMQIPFQVTGTFQNPHFKLDAQRLISGKAGGKLGPGNLQQTIQGFQGLFKKKNQ